MVSLMGIGLGAVVAAGGLATIRWSRRPRVCAGRDRGAGGVWENQKGATREADTGCAGVALLLFGTAFALLAVISDLG